MKKIYLGLTLLFSVFLVGCAPDISPNSYEVASVGTVNRVIPGTIMGMRPVKVNANSGVGAAAGSATGAVVGASVGGNGIGGVIGGVAGAVAVGVAGNAIDSSVNSQIAMEYMVRTEKGKILSVVQGRDLHIKIGERVFVIFGAESKIIPEDVYLGRRSPNKHHA